MHQKRQMVNVYLGGKLGKLFGEKWTLAVSTPHEAIHAINVNTRGAFKRYLGTEGKSKYYKVGIGGKDKTIGAEELTHKSGSSDIYITPTTRGRNSPGLRIVIGVVLIAAALIFQQYEVAPEAGDLIAGTEAVAGTSPILVAAANIALAVGISLVLGGISQLLSPHQNQGGELGSNYFQGAAAAGAQGGCVPVVYGKALVTPITISIWFNNVDYNTTQSAYVGVLEVAQLNGGGTEFVPVAPVSNQGNTSSNNTADPSIP